MIHNYFIPEKCPPQKLEKKIQFGHFDERKKSSVKAGWFNEIRHIYWKISLEELSQFGWIFFVRVDLELYVDYWVVFLY